MAFAHSLESKATILQDAPACIDAILNHEFKIETTPKDTAEFIRLGSNYAAWLFMQKDNIVLQEQLQKLVAIVTFIETSERNAPGRFVDYKNAMNVLNQQIPQHGLSNAMRECAELFPQLQKMRNLKKLFRELEKIKDESGLESSDRDLINNILFAKEKFEKALLECMEQNENVFSKTLEEILNDLYENMHKHSISELLHHLDNHKLPAETLIKLKDCLKELDDNICNLYHQQIISIKNSNRQKAMDALDQEIPERKMGCTLRQYAHLLSQKTDLRKFFQDLEKISRAPGLSTLDQSRIKDCFDAKQAFEKTFSETLQDTFSETPEEILEDIYKHYNQTESWELTSQVYRSFKDDFKKANSIISGLSSLNSSLWNLKTDNATLYHELDALKKYPALRFFKKTAFDFFLSKSYCTYGKDCTVGIKLYGLQQFLAHHLALTMDKPSLSILLTKFAAHHETVSSFRNQMSQIRNKFYSLEALQRKLERLKQRESELKEQLKTTIEKLENSKDLAPAPDSIEQQNRQDLYLLKELERLDDLLSDTEKELAKLVLEIIPLRSEATELERKLAELKGIALQHEDLRKEWDHLNQEVAKLVTQTSSQKFAL